MILHILSDEKKLSFYNLDYLKEFTRKLRESGNIPDEAISVVVQINDNGAPYVIGYFMQEREEL